LGEGAGLASPFSEADPLHKRRTMNIKTQILNSGFITGGPRLAQLLKQPPKDSRPSWLKNQKVKRTWNPLRWMLIGSLILLSLTPAFAAPSVELIWEPVSTYEDGLPIEDGQVVQYDVWRSLDPNLTAPVRVGVGLTTVRCVDATVTPKSTYYYYILTYLVDGMFSEKSNTASVRVWPPFKTKITAIAIIK